MTFRWAMPGAALVLIGLIGCGPSAEKSATAEEHPEAAEAHVVVRTEPARRSTLAETVEGLGQCEALPERLAMLTPVVAGHVEHLLVKQGETVKQGQPIVEFNKSVALADLEEKKAMRDGLRASLELLKSLPRPDERRANELAVALGKLSVERTQRIADRLRPLLARREVSEQNLYEAENAAEQAKIQQQTAEAQLKAMMIGPRPEAVAEAESKITTAEAAVEFSKAHLAFHTIRSPIDGVLDSLNCHPGQAIAIGTPIGEVVDTQQVLAILWLAPRSAQLVKAGQSAKIHPTEPASAGASHEDADKHTLAGKVEFVGRIADPQTGNLPVHVLVDNPEGLLTVGETVQVTVTVEEREGVLQVPSAAIFDEGEGPILTVVRDGKTVLLHPEVGPPHEGWVEVLNTDLKEGDLVIVEGGYHLPEGTPVKMSDEPKPEAEGHDEPKKDEHDDAPKKGEPKQSEPKKAAQAEAEK
jgi:RND family efflux transporter MFP subunit